MNTQSLALILGMISTAPGEPAARVVDANAPDVEAIARSIERNQVLRIEQLVVDSAEPPIDIELRRFRVFAPNARIVVHTDEGEILRPVPRNVYLQGAASGDPRTLAVFTVREAGGLRGLVARKGRRWGITARKDGGGLQAVELDTQGTRSFECSAGVLPAQPNRHRQTHEVDAPAALATGPHGEPRFTARMAIETDWEFFQLFGNVTDAADYAADLVGYMSVIYTNEIGLSCVITHLSLWGTEADPWEQQDDEFCAALEFVEYWNTANVAVKRSAANMFSGRPIDAGIALIDVLCAESGGGTVALPFDCRGLPDPGHYDGGDYAYSGGMNGGFDFDNPLSVRDIQIVAHEFGHNVGSLHTHCYADIGGYSEPVDRCSAPLFECPFCTCGATSLPKDCPGPGLGCGTIMSYCWDQPGSFDNIALTLGTDHPYGVHPERVPNLMLEAVEAAHASNPGCLDPILDCISDLDDSGAVGGDDLNLLLRAWGPCPVCPEDLTGDENVGFADLSLLLNNWGRC